MSQYLSSIFIDPVVRQARRFSRPSSNNEPPHGTIWQPRHGSNASLSNPDSSAVAEDTQEDQGLLTPNLGTNISSTTTTTRSFEILLPDSEAGGLDGELQAWEHSHGLEVPSLDVETASEHHPHSRPARHLIPHTNDDSSNNPHYGFPDSFESTTSSSTNSTRSLRDANLPSTRNMVHSSTATTVQVSQGGTRSQGSQGSHVGDRSLPADDGMSHVRKKILAIQSMEITSAEKARLIHDLMTEQYILTQSNLHTSHFPRPRSPASFVSQERPFTPLSTHSTDKTLQSMSPPTSMSSVAESMNQFHLTQEDLRPTYVPNPLDEPTPAGDDKRLDEVDGKPPELMDEPKILGCRHYRRNIKLQCSSCDRWYTCRFCHDDVEDHSLNRRETKNMLCMLCGFAQPASEECTKCGIRGAWYYCGVCKLWDDDPKKSIYHCNDCGICRVGKGLGKDFYHCKTCCVCLSISIQDTHRCIERSTDCDCPICGEYMFTSPRTVVFMRCGHSIHQRCYYEHMNSSYKCPICSRSIVNMEMQFRHLERAIESQPMPPQFQDTKALVYCNDCSAKTTVKYHWLGLKCAICDSYNTAQIRILGGSDPERNPSEVLNAPPSPESFTHLAPSRINSFSRGRDLQPSGSSHRVAISAPPADNSQLQPTVPLRRIARSESPSLMNQFHLGSSFDSASSDPEDSMDTDEDYDEVEFWGGESPSGWIRLPLSRMNPEEGPSSEDEDAGDDDDDDDDEDDDDDDDDDDMDTDMSDDADGDGMEIFGHR